jgi:hypothetical protein
MASIFPSLFDGTMQRVAMRMVDVILAGRPSAVWKLDVEGAEADDQGARDTLEHSPPRAIIAELYDPFMRVRRPACPNSKFGEPR